MLVDSRWLGPALALSVLANLFLAGMAASHWLPSAPPAAASGQGLTSPGRVGRLPAEERTRFRQAMAAYRPQMRAARKVVREARARVEADIAAPVYDRERTEADFAALRTATTAQQEATQAAVVQALTQISPASRAALVQHEGARGSGPSIGVGNTPAAR